MQLSFRQAFGTCLVGETPTRLGASNWGWIDKKAALLHVLSDQTEYRRFKLSFEPAFVLRSPSGIWACASSDQIVVKAGRTSKKASLLEGGLRLNDGWISPANTVFAGAVPTRMGQKGSLFRFGDDLDCVDDDILVANGMVLEPESSRLFVVDTGRKLIFSYAYDRQKDQLSGRQIWCDLTDEVGKPDGIAVAPDGSLFCAMWDGRALLSLDRQGRIKDRFDMPILRPTSICFTHTNLIVTTASIGLEPDELSLHPLSGSTLLYDLSF